ncbi:hypothetical protein KM043_006475 [Ampulex compressa]|nr:hypothetical protein KM043_006475 [Ampulex compressa]
MSILLKRIKPNFMKTKTALLSDCTPSSMDNEQCAKKPKLEVDILKEGKAEILVKNKNVFYNPVQEFNRDLSIAVLTLFAKNRANEVPKKASKVSKHADAHIKNTTDLEKHEGITVLEALSATGLRSIRYAKEVPAIKKIIANDISANAVESITNNVRHNEVEHLVVPNHEDATLFMYRNKKSVFDAVDLDPYGCPTPFLDAAVQCISDGGLLMVTATDMAVLAGNSPETCYLKYGAVSLKSKACHEIALRILLQNIASHAARYGRFIVPLLSVSVDFYIRVFVKVYSSQIKCKDNATKVGRIYQCSGCETFSVQPLCVKKGTAYKLPSAPHIDELCKHCCHKHHIGGPIWLDPLHNQEFIAQMLCSLNDFTLGTLRRIEGVLHVIHEELDVPLYYTLDRLMSVIKCFTPPMKVFRSALLNAGYKVSYSHANKISIKTDAPNNVIWDIVRAWEKLHPIKRDKLPEDSPGIHILDTPSTTEINFDIHPFANPMSRQKHLARFQQNPTANWGPGTRSKTMIHREEDEPTLKRIKNQNKKSTRASVQMIEDDKNNSARVS